jgi:hypothetical protein
MQILSEILPLRRKEFIVDQYKSTLYPIPQAVLDYVTNQLLPGNTVVLFSGEHRFNLDATYIEPKFLLPLTTSTRNTKIIFADPGNTELLAYTLAKLQIKNLLLLSNATFIRYRNWQEIKNDIDYLKKYTKQLIVTLPITRFDFNRLKYSNNDIAVKLGGVLQEDTVIICQSDY